MPGPLHGLRVLELAHIILGPLACQILADMGAEVIKVEAPPTGDNMRTLGAVKKTPNMASLFLACNRNKRSVVLDLKNKSARKVVLKLAESADVVFHNNRPQVMTKLGLDYAAFKQVNPSIVYCGAYGYSRKGPYGERGAMDEAVQSATGIAMLNKLANNVARGAPTAIADKTVGMTAAYAVLGALFHRARTGEGQEVEVPMFETLTNYMMAEHLAGLTFTPPAGGGGYAPAVSSHRRPFPTSDGFIAITPVRDPHWETFATLSGHGDLRTDPRFATYGARMANIDGVYQAIAKVMTGRSTAAWFALFKDTAMPIAVLNTLEELVDDPHLKAVDFWQMMDSPTEGKLRMPGFPVRYGDSPADYRRPPPRLGEHSFEVLKEAGLSQVEIDALLAEGATQQAV